MAINTTVQVDVTTTGDGENQTDSFFWAANPSAPRSPTKILVSGNTSVSVPTNAKGFIAIAPSAAGTYTLKGVSGDTGVGITAGGIAACRLSSPGAISTFVLAGSVSGIWTVIWT